MKKDSAPSLFIVASLSGRVHSPEQNKVLFRSMSAWVYLRFIPSPGEEAG